MNRKWMLLSLIAMVLVGIWLFYKYNFNIAYRVGQPIDSLNGVVVYYNGAVGHVSGRNLTKDKYNLGQKYQCVEFVKRYYYEYYKHKMPDSYGHAKDFFDASVSDGALNTKRDLIQYTNPSMSMPKQGDLLVYSGTVANRFGHVAIVAKVHKDGIEIIQQNPGMYGSSRGVYGLRQEQGKWRIVNDRIMGWLRMKAQP